MALKKGKNKVKGDQIANLKDAGIVIYQTNDGSVELKVKLEGETLWLTQYQIAFLFDTKRPAITKHLNNIFKSYELNKNSVCSILEHTAADGKAYKTQFYNLDAIISVGYRVNSKRATQFRIWATKVMKDYLVQGYAINQKRLFEQTEKFKALQQIINFLKDKSKYPELQDKTEELFSLFEDYSKSLTILNQYDEGSLTLVKEKTPHYVLTYKECKDLIETIKTNLIKKNEASALFGQEVNKQSESIVGATYQTFDREELYQSIEEKAANLLYLIIKDHPFVDGNKRIGSLLFLHFLAKNNYLLKQNNEKKINDNTIVALALLIANSLPQEKEVMINIITNLLKE